MKCLCIITLAIVCLGVYQNSYAEIINGYDHELKAAQQKIDNLNAIAKVDLSKDQRIRLEKWLKSVHKTAEKLRENQAKTQALIEQFRSIDPGLYHEINTIKDREGNKTDVYIKVVDKLSPGLDGATNVAHSIDNPNVYNSEYGDYSVSVRVTHTNQIMALRVLVHELGHVRYQVPHLAEYTTYYKQAYQDSNRIGHHANDPSYQSVNATLHIFIESLRENNREMRWMAQNKYRKILASKQED